jgi:hypothetical protein
LGDINLDLNRIGNVVKGEVTISEGMEASFLWKGRTVRLRPGRQAIAEGP